VFASEQWVTLGFVLAIVLAVVVATASLMSITRIRDDGIMTSRAQEVIATLDELIATATDAETASRGYAITGDVSYLQPYEQAAQHIGLVLEHLASTIVDNNQTQRLEKLSPLIERRMEIIRAVIKLRRDDGFEAARTVIATGSGKAVHDAIRRHIDEMEEAESQLLKQRLAKSEASSQFAMIFVALGSLVSVGISIFTLFFIRRDFSGGRRAYAMLKRSNSDLDDFAYIASHDLKEPLRGLHNYASILQEDYGASLDDDGKRYLERMQRLVERLTSLIDSLLAYSRLGSSALPVASVALDQVLDEVAKDVHTFLEERGVELVRATPLPVVICNALRVGEVFQNLITNAAKYNDKPEKRVEIGCNATEKIPVFYVRDNGIGIAPQHQDSVFRIFKRLHEQNKFGGGTGAGLTIAKKIVERHGGRIWLDSKLGEGTTFYFTLSGEAS